MYLAAYRTDADTALALHAYQKRYLLLARLFLLRASFRLHSPMGSYHYCNGVTLPQALRQVAAMWDGGGF